MAGAAALGARSLAIEQAEDLGLLQDIDRVTHISTQLVSVLMWINYVKKRIRDEDPAVGSTYRMFAWLSLLSSIPITYVWAESSVAQVFVGSLMVWAPNYIALCVYDIDSLESMLERRVYGIMAATVLFAMSISLGGAALVDPSSMEYVNHTLHATTFAHLSLFVHMAVFPTQRRWKYALGAFVSLLCSVRPVSAGRAALGFSSILLAMYLTANLPRQHGHFYLSRPAMLSLAPLAAIPYALGAPHAWVWGAVTAAVWLIAFDSYINDPGERTPADTNFTEEESIPLLVPADIGDGVSEHEP